MNQPLPGVERAGQMNINEMQETGMNILETVASVVTMPVEILLRVQFGSRYFAAPIWFFSAMVFIFASAFLDVSEGLGNMLNFGHARGPAGLYGLGSFTTLFFLVSLVHGCRVWRRMLHMELEDVSTFEGHALPIFDLLPKGRNFWVVRIIYEPVFVGLVAVILSNTLIIQTPLKIYLEIAALFLAMKNYIAWFRAWSYLRDLLDMAHVGPLLGKIIDKSATESDMARVHMASLPKDLSPDLRKATVAHLSRNFVSHEPDQNRSHEAGFVNIRLLTQIAIIGVLLFLGILWFTGNREFFQKHPRIEHTEKHSPFGQPVANDSPATPVAPNLALTKLSGYWQGGGYIAGRGFCTFHLEIRPGQEAKVAGYSTLACTSVGQRRAFYSPVRVTVPISAILTGSVDANAIRFQSTKAIDGTKAGCATRNLTVTTFGVRQIAAEWRDGCQGGELILQRVNQ